jgi:hypothetical protein
MPTLQSQQAYQTLHSRRAPVDLADRPGLGSPYISSLAGGQTSFLIRIRLQDRGAGDPKSVDHAR